MAQIERVNAHFDGTLNHVHTMIFAADTGKNDIYTFKEMLQEDDKSQFIEAMLKEIAVHEDRNHWDVISRSDLPSGAKTIMAIWSFKRKRLPDGQILKYKARLCAHGGMQQWGVNYWETYAPVVNWMSVRILLAVASIHRLETRSIDFVLAFPQAKLDVDVFMELPIGIEIEDDVPNSHRYVLKLNRNLYGLKQGSANWFEMLQKGLTDRDFLPSRIDPCVYYRDDAIILVYVDDCIIISKDSTTIDAIVHSLQNGPEKFELTDEGTMQRYLGVEIKQLDDYSFEMFQPFLIKRIIDYIGIDGRMTNSRETPVGKPLLHKDLEGKPRKHTWNYRAAVGMLSYLTGSTRPELAMAVHQCARFNAGPMLSHERAIKRIGRYLIENQDRGIVYTPDKTKGIECYVDADFAGGWSQADAENPENVMSRTGYVIMYAGCPVLWCSKLQTEIALSTAEAEYIALSQAMREVIPLMNFMAEVSCIFDLDVPKPKIKCKVFEDNRSCISIAEASKFTPRTKHIALKYHHFRRFVKEGTIEIFPIDTSEQTADIFTKPLDDYAFLYLRKKLNGW